MTVSASEFPPRTIATTVGVAAIVLCHCGTPATAEAALQPIRQFGTPALDAIARTGRAEMYRFDGDGSGCP